MSASPVPSPSPAPRAIPLYQLASALQEVLDDHFGGQHLLTAEVASLSDTNARGHCYLELLDKNPQTGEETRIRATIWANKWRVISHYFQQETGQKIAKGLQILFEGSLAFHPTYGLSINITNIDAGYTLGRQKQALEQILKRLQTEGLLEKQQQLRVEPVFQRIAVISSPSAAGYQDFEHQLDAKTYGYSFTRTLFTATMQGADTEASVLNALQAIARRAADFDSVAILRGGGADQDLVAFNSYAIGKALAEFPLPILSGIGHERDTTVPDLVAFERLKTPTAVAEYLIDLAATFEGRVDAAQNRLTQKATQQLMARQNQLARAENTYVGVVARYVPNQNNRVTSLADRLAAAAKRTLERGHQKVDVYEKQTQLLDPKVLLKRGYALVFTPNGLAHAPEELQGPLRILVEKGEASGTFTPQ